MGVERAVDAIRWARRSAADERSLPRLAHLRQLPLSRLEEGSFGEYDVPRSMPLLPHPLFDAKGKVFGDILS